MLGAGAPSSSLSVCSSTSRSRFETEGVLGGDGAFGLALFRVGMNSFSKKSTPSSILEDESDAVAFV